MYAFLAKLRYRIAGVRLLSLVTVPAMIALLLMGLAFVLIWMETLREEVAETLWPLDISYDTATSFLSVVATGAITALSLAYSLVLVVFTLAAGNIGPRLLKRFSTDRVNQVTAGLFGGTFLHALTTLYATEPGFVPQLAIGGTGFLAVLSVAQLIYFVREVSTSVSIDDEIAEIANGLERDIGRLIAGGETTSVTLDEDRIDFSHTLRTERSGYIGHVDWHRLATLAAEEDVVVKFAERRGRFLIRGQTLLHLSDAIGDDSVAAMRNCIEIAEARSMRDNIEFSIHLLLEIALRALSPGVNDTFTAITCVDRLSSALAGPAESGMRQQVMPDDDGVPRVLVPGMSAADLIGTAYHPMRRASRDNVLMARHLADALVRLAEVARDEVRAALEEHARLLLREIEANDFLPEDLAFVRQRLAPLLEPGAAAEA